MDNRKPLSIPALDTIEVILQAIEFLEYSTQKRNLAYLIQLRRLLMLIYENYKIDRGLSKVFKYNLIRINCDIMESTLYCALTTAKIDPNPRTRSHPRLEQYINAAKRYNLILKTTAERAKKVNTFRNNLHPNRQLELHAKISEEDYLLSKKAANDIMENLFIYFNKQSEINLDDIPF